MKLRTLLLDLGGVFYQGDHLIPGALEALARLRDERPEDHLQEDADERLRLGPELEAVLVEERADGDEREEPQRDGDGPVERGPDPACRLHPREVPQVERREPDGAPHSREVYGSRPTV